MLKRLTAITGTTFCLLTGVVSASATAPQQDRPALVKSSAAEAERDKRRQDMLASAIRHELVTLPYYDVFDWLQAELLPDGTVILQGEVVRPNTARDAEYRVRKIESATRVINQIKVLSVSPHDDDLRIALYRAIYNWNSPLFRYAMRAMPPIHIIVENGRVTLKGAVGTPLESQLAYTAARQTPGIFEVKNELQVDKM